MRRKQFLLALAFDRGLPSSPSAGNQLGNWEHFISCSIDLEQARFISAQRNNETSATPLFYPAGIGMNNSTENDSALVPSLSLDRRLDIPDQKSRYIDSLLRTLDALIFLQLGVTYLCDNLTFLLLLRAVSQVLHVQYRPPGATQLSPVIFANVVCFMTHLLQHKTSTKRLHGGLIIDFVGELGASKWKLLFLDLVVLGLQLLMLVAGYEKQVASDDAQIQDESQPQDLESEEAGRLRSRAQEQGAETDEGIELQTLLPERSGDDDAPPHNQVEISKDDDLVVLDMRKGLRALLRRPPPTASPATMESPATRAGLATFLARVAAARARAA